MKKLILFPLLVIVLPILLTQCEKDNITQVPDKESGKISIQMNLKSMPVDVMQIDGILFRQGSDTIHIDFVFTGEHATALIEGIPVGEWQLQVYAYNSSGDIIYAGSVEVEVKVGEITPVQIHLSKTGGIDITVTWGDDPGLMAYYPFNGNARDESGNENHGIVHGANLSTDRFGNANSSYAFDGVDDYISIPHAPSLNFGSGDFTVSLWVIYESTAGEQVFIEKWIERHSESDGWTLTKLEHDNIIRFALGDDAYRDIDTRQLTIPLYTWHHLALIRSDQTISFYWDGIFIQSGTLDHSYNLNSEASIKIGHRGNPENTPGSMDESGFFIHGNMDDIAIYNYALSANELSTVYHSGGWDTPGDDINSSLLAYYPFNGNANDESGNNYHGKVMGATLTEDRFGNANSAYYFDGINNEIYLEDQSGLDISGDITICAWFKTETPQWGSLVSNFDQHMPDNGYELCIGSLYEEGGFVYFELAKDDIKDGLSTNSSFNDGKWHFVVATLAPDGISRRRVFVDAVEQSGYNKEGSGPIPSIGPTPDYPFKIGAASNKTGPEGRANYIGVIDDVRIYGRTLTLEEINTLFRYGGWDDK